MHSIPVTGRQRITITLFASAILSGGLAVPARAAAGDPEQQSVAAPPAAEIGQRAAVPLQPAILPRAATRSAAEARIATLLNLRIPRQQRKLGRNFSIRVTDADSGAVIFDRRPYRRLLPASNMKIVTAADALTVLGPTTKYTTRVKLLAQGAVALVGGGDATLSDQQLDTLANEVAAASATNPALTPAPGSPIQVFYDDSLFSPPEPRVGWLSGYSPGVVRPVTALGRIGRYVTNPSGDAASFLASRLRARGINAAVRGPAITDTAAPVIASSQGATVLDQVRYMLQVSENNIAENLFYLVAAARGLPTTWRGARLAAMSILAGLGVPTNGINLTSGSGVGRSDRLTVTTLNFLLRRIADQTNYPNLGSIYYGGSLPLAGRTGTLGPRTGRFTTAPSRCAAGRVSAKTGTLHDVVALSGLTIGADNRMKAFSIIVNNRPERRFSALQTRRAVDVLVATVNGCY